MALWLKLCLAVVFLIVAGVATAVTIGSVRWRRASARMVERLRAERGPSELRPYTLQDLEGLPEPVARYFRLVLREGQPLVRSVRLTQRGAFYLGDWRGGWRPLEATQHFSARPPAFVWDARILLAPLVAVRVRDAYLEGEGSMQGQLLALITLVDERGRSELNEGALQRYLAEAVWFPTALLPSQGVRWTAIDDSTAEATLADAGNRVSLRFTFNAAGEAVGVFTPGRYREVGGDYELTPWTGRFGNYALRDGIRVPLEASVEWTTADGPLLYFRGRVEAIEYDLLTIR